MTEGVLLSQLYEEFFKPVLESNCPSVKGFPIFTKELAKPVRIVLLGTAREMPALAADTVDSASRVTRKAIPSAVTDAHRDRGGCSFLLCPCSCNHFHAVSIPTNSGGGQTHRPGDAAFHRNTYPCVT